jgi:hypothetical protein
MSVSVATEIPSIVYRHKSTLQGTNSLDDVVGRIEHKIISGEPKALMHLSEVQHIKVGKHSELQYLSLQKVLTVSPTGKRQRSRMPRHVFYVWDFLTFSRVQHPL